MNHFTTDGISVLTQASNLSDLFMTLRCLLILVRNSIGLSMLCFQIIEHECLWIEQIRIGFIIFAEIIVF